MADTSNAYASKQARHVRSLRLAVDGKLLYCLTTSPLSLLKLFNCCACNYLTVVCATSPLSFLTVVQLLPQTAVQVLHVLHILQVLHFLHILYILYVLHGLHFLHTLQTTIRHPPDTL